MVSLSRHFHLFAFAVVGRIAHAFGPDQKSSMRWSGIQNFPLAEDSFTFVIAVVSDFVAFYVFLVPESVASGKVVSATKDKVAKEVAAFSCDPGFRKIQNQFHHMTFSASMGHQEEALPWSAGEPLVVFQTRLFRR